MEQDPGIELLVTLAKNGEIDPWDVDIVKVTDRYLAALDQLDDRLLAACGRGIFYACLLLNMKARILAVTFVPISIEPGIDDFADAGDLGPEDGELDWARVVATDDGVLLVPRGRPRTRPISLDDLINALKRCDAFEKKRKEAGLPPSSFFVGTTHQDDVARDVEIVRRLITRLARGRKGVAFGRLLQEGLSAGSAFLALLFMAAAKEVSLSQKGFYEELQVAEGGGRQ